MDLSELPILANNKILFKKIRRDPALPGNIVPCMMCGKPFIMPVFIGAPDQMCGECIKTYADTAKLVCRKCNATVCRLAPKLLDSGYYIRPHSILHIKECGICNEGLKESAIEEIEQWERTQRNGRLVLTGGWR